MRLLHLSRNQHQDKKGSKHGVEKCDIPKIYVYYKRMFVRAKNDHESFFRSGVKLMILLFYGNFSTSLFEQCNKV